VQDPGNVGTLIRSCAAFGMGGLIISRDSADPFSPRAARASAGAVLRCPLVRAADLGKLLRALGEAGYSTYWTGAQGETTLRELPREGLLAVFIGSEGRGFSEEDRRAIGAGVRIPAASQVESLNAGVAGSIVAYELSAQLG
jgi:tRNA G18 (ribose-2'-O)-methylase SpoU